MISVNGTLVAMGAFPDKTSAMRYNPNDDGYTITWKYDGDHECMALWYLVHHIRENCGAYTPIHLNIPYLPNARMDRVKNFDEVFTLKWFADFINALHFCRVTVFDPHSNVATALINTCMSLSPLGISAERFPPLVWRISCFATRTKAPPKGTPSLCPPSISSASSTGIGARARLSGWN